MATSSRDLPVLQQSLKHLSGLNQYRDLKLLPPVLPAPSLVWRGDSILLGSQLPRWALRAHYYETTSAHRLVGFANLRPLDEILATVRPRPDDVPTVAEAYLAPPKHLCDSGCVIYPASDLGALYGYSAGQFDGPLTCFSMPYRSHGGVCAHACTFMSVVMLSGLNRAPSIPAVHEMSHKVAEATGERKRLSDGTDLLPVRGLGFREIRTLLQSTLIDAGAVLEILTIDPGGDGESRQFAVHALHEYLRQGLPVILRVDSWRMDGTRERKPWWLRWLYRPRPHAVVLVGAKGLEGAESIGFLPDVFVCHDPRMGPYIEKDVHDLLRAAAYRRNCVVFVVAGPSGVNLELSRVLSLFNSRQVRAPEGSALLASRGPDQVAPRASLVPRADLAQWYFGHLADGHPVRRFLSRYEHSLPQWVWAAEQYSTQDVARREASAVWFFDATRGKDTGWAGGLFAMWDNEVFRCEMEGVSPCSIIIKGRLPVRTRRLQESSAWRP